MNGNRKNTISLWWCFTVRGLLESIIPGNKENTWQVKCEESKKCQTTYRNTVCLMLHRPVFWLIKKLYMVSSTDSLPCLNTGWWFGESQPAEWHMTLEMSNCVHATADLRTGRNLRTRSQINKIFIPKRNWIETTGSRKVSKITTQQLYSLSTNTWIIVI